MNDKTLDLIQNNLDSITKQIPEAAKSAHEIAVMYVQWSSLLNITSALTTILFCLIGVGIGAFIGYRIESSSRYSDGFNIFVGAGIGLIIGLALGLMIYDIIKPIFYYLNPDFAIIDMIIHR